MVCIEDLSQEELVWLLRKVVTPADELQLLVDVLERRQMKTIHRMEELIEVQNQCWQKKDDLMAPYCAGKVYRVPWNVHEKIKENEKNREKAFQEFMECSGTFLSISDQRNEVITALLGIKYPEYSR